MGEGRIYDSLGTASSDRFNLGCNHARIAGTLSLRDGSGMFNIRFSVIIKADEKLIPLAKFCKIFRNRAIVPSRPALASCPVLPSLRIAFFNKTRTAQKTRPIPARRQSPRINRPLLDENGRHHVIPHAISCQLLFREHGPSPPKISHDPGRAAQNYNFSGWAVSALQIASNGGAARWTRRALPH